MFRLEIFYNEMLEKIQKAELLLTKKSLISEKYPLSKKSI